MRETLLEVAATPRHLGARIGGQMVLHTWGQTLQMHPHVHVILPGGGLTDDGQWKACPRGFFLPVQVLRRVFRGKLLALLRHAHESDGLRWTGGLGHLAQPSAFGAFLRPLYDKEWNVYAKPPTGSAEQVLKYLAHYTHRVAISNRRIESLSADGQVTFTYKDYAHGGRVRRMTLPAEEFLRRFSQHVLPRGFVRLRGFGLLANCDSRAEPGPLPRGTGSRWGRGRFPSLRGRAAGGTGRCHRRSVGHAASLPALRASHAAADGPAAASDRARVDRQHLSPTANGHVVMRRPSDRHPPRPPWGVVQVNDLRGRTVCRRSTEGTIRATPPIARRVRESRPA